ncbi:MAG: DUF4097 family beta strand repeat protein [Halanaerobiales bacterium]|nr:DUF4097 family beta strand repeat protein [Halanaerobiales bacterium]
MKNKVLLFSVMISMIILLGGCVEVNFLSNGRYEYKEYIEENFAAFDFLTLVNFQGSVLIEPSDTEEIKIQAVKVLKGDSEERLKEVAEEVKIDFIEKSSELIIKTKRPIPRPSKIGSMGVDFKIILPRETQVVIDTNNGSIKVNGLQNKLILTTSNGSIKVDEYQGNLIAKSSNGSISVNKIEGNLNLHTSNGRIVIENVLGEINAETSNGSIRVDTEFLVSNADLATSNGRITFKGKMDRAGDYKFKSSNSSMELWIDPILGYDLFAKTSNGKIQFDFPITFIGTNEAKYMEGKFNGGGIDLTVRTSNGNIYFKDWSEN